MCGCGMWVWCVPDLIFQKLEAIIIMLVVVVMVVHVSQGDLIPSDNIRLH